MNVSNSFSRAFRFLSSAAAMLIGGALQAQLIWDVNLNTSALIGHPAGPFYLDFQLNDGAGVGDANNTAVVSHFNFAGGSALGAPSLFGGASGSLASAVTLTDSEAFNEFFQAFTPGTSLSFRLTLSTATSGPIPDLFSFAILDASLANIPTQSFGNDVFFQVDITGVGAEPQVFASDDSLAPSAGGSPLALIAPSATAVPEPSTYGLAGIALVAGLICLRRRARSRVCTLHCEC
jgi:hypothetical protein